MKFPAYIRLLLLIASIQYAGVKTFSQAIVIDKPFMDGMITIKVKEGFGTIVPQKGKVSFNHPEMDRIVEKFNIYEVDKRFRHRRIPKNSGLPDLSRIYRIGFDVKHSVGAVVLAFSQVADIEYAEPVSRAYLCQIPDDTLYSLQQHLPQIMAAQAWDIHHGEDGPIEIVVGINDTGVDWDHPDLVDNLWHNLGEDADGDGQVLEYIGGNWILDPGDLNGIDDDGSGFVDDLIGWDFFMNNNNPDPNAVTTNYMHGTHVAGIAAGRTNNTIGISSVSWNIKFFPTQIASGDMIPWGYDAIIYQAEMGVDIISNSWATWFTAKAEEEAIAYATGLGSIIVAAAGNQETDLMSRFPAGYPGVISVAAVNGGDMKSSFSNWGPWVDVCAPGGDVGELILSTVPGGTYAGSLGTSMATPMVAGLLGLVKSYRPNWSNDQLIMHVLGTADDIDAQNPGLENNLGTGRINAYRALVETNVTGPEELRLEFISALPDDENANGILEAGESVWIDLKMWNRCPVSRSYNTSFTISSDDPDIIILQDEKSVYVPYDSYFTIYDAFHIEIIGNAQPHVAKFTLDISSDIDITIGDHFEFYLPLLASGALVYEGQESGDSYSGIFISAFMDNHEIDHVYTSGFPETMAGYDMAFLSFGNWGSDSGYTWVRDQQVEVMTEFLESGRKIYAEAPDLFSKFQIKNPYFQGLFGLNYAWDGTSAQNPVSGLSGSSNALTSGLYFNESDQQQNISIASFETNIYGIPAFVQLDDTLGVQQTGPFQQKTFVFSYSLAELVDYNAVNSRFNLLYRILNFFGYNFGDGYVIANFVADTLQGDPGLQVSFTDWSLYSSSHPITYWAWDINDDGITDSWEQNPVWQFDTSGLYSVSLTAATDSDTNTFTREDYILINQGTNISQLNDDIELTIYPNPARNMLIVDYNLMESSHVLLEIFDVSGTRIEQVFDNWETSGSAQFNLNPGQYQNGVYILRITTGNNSKNQKFLVVR